MKTVKTGPPYSVPDGCPSAEEFAVLFNRPLARRGSSLRRAARATGLHEKTLQRYSNGSHQPSEQAIDLLVNELGISRAELLGTDYVSYAASKLRREREHKLVTDAFDQLAEKEKQDLLKVPDGWDVATALSEKLEILARIKSEALLDLLFRLMDFSEEVCEEVAEAGFKIVDREEFGAD